MWRGPALADIRDERFALPEAARLDDLRLTCLSERVDADLACGRHAGLAGELEALVGEHPLRERLRAQRMLALYREGRQAEALAEYRDARLALVDGLGIEPSPELRALEAAILRHDVPPPQAARPGVALDARRSVTCLVARLARPEANAELDPESHRAVLDRFHEAASAACDRHGGSVTELRGDSIAGVFGIPVATRTMRSAPCGRARRAPARARPPVRLRSACGASTGDVVGAARVASAPVIGEPVAAAERLARRAGAGEIWIGASTWRLVCHAARADEAGGDATCSASSTRPRRRSSAGSTGRSWAAPRARRLHGAFDRVATARAPELLTVAGEPGIGKSRLVAEVAAAAGGRRVLCARCPAYGEGLTYAPLREIVLQAAGDRRSTSSRRASGWRRHGAPGGGSGGHRDRRRRRRDRARVPRADRGARPRAAAGDRDRRRALGRAGVAGAAARRRRAAARLAAARRLGHPRASGRGRRRARAGAAVAEASAGLLAEIAAAGSTADERRVAEAAGGNPLFLERSRRSSARPVAGGAAVGHPRRSLAARLDARHAERAASRSRRWPATTWRRTRSTRSRAASRAPTWSRRATAGGAPPAHAGRPRRAPLPPRADPRRRVRVAGEVGARAAARAPRVMAGRPRARARRRRRADRPAPGAGVPPGRRG